MKSTVLMIGLVVMLSTSCATSTAPVASAPGSDDLTSGAAGRPPAAAPPGDGPMQVGLPAPPSGGCDARIGVDGLRLRRSAVKRTVDAGLGRWLQTISIDPLLARGHFKGWIIRALPADDSCYTGVDLRAGDVVTRVNGRSIERPEEAQTVWVGLPSSSELVVDLVRDGSARTLRLGIVDK